MQKVWQAREDGLEIYFTMDAGPNLKLLFLKENQAAVKVLFPKVQIVNPFPQA
jgi:diphosphomevalonate decarboxylase